MKLPRTIKKIKRARKTYHAAKTGKNLYIIVSGTRTLAKGAKKLLTPRYEKPLP